MHTSTDSVSYPDVHHANGTEETVRYLRPVLEARDTLDPRSFGTLYSPVYKPWHDQTDSSNVFLVSVHGFGTRERGLEYLLPRAAFYPGTGKTVYPSYSSLERPAQSSDELSAPVPVQSKVTDMAAEVSDGDGDENEPNDDVDRDGDDDEDDDSEDDDDSFNPNGEAYDASSEEEQELGVQERATVQALKRIYGSYSMLRDSNKLRVDGAPGDMSAPLILDVGIGLPEPDIDDGGLSYRYSWRNYWRNEIFPRLLRFQPDLILVSAGFDAHKKVSSMCHNLTVHATRYLTLLSLILPAFYKDLINGGYLALLEEDYDWLTHRLVQIANVTCDGRVVSSLVNTQNIFDLYTLILML